MKRLRFINRGAPRIILSAVLAVGGVSLMMTSVTSATTPPTPKVTGGVELVNPLQYVSFSAFASTPAKGSVTYTNFDYRNSGTGVWNLGSIVDLAFAINGNEYDHTMVITSEDAQSPNSLTFTANGTYDRNSLYKWTATGAVIGTTVTINLIYTGANPGYNLALIGTIASDGSIVGTESGSSTGTWTSPTGTAFEVLSYTTPVTCALVNDELSPAFATFGFTIPPGVSLAGLPIVMKVTDGGSPGAGNDTWGQAVVSSCSPDQVFSPYTIIGGNLVIH